MVIVVYWYLFSFWMFFFFFLFLFLHFIRFRLSLVWYVICDYWMTSQNRRKNKLLGAVRSFYRLVHFYRNVGFSICICICLNMNIVAAEKSKLRLSDKSINWCKVFKFVVVAVFLTDNIHNLYCLKDNKNWDLLNVYCRLEYIFLDRKQDIRGNEFKTITLFLLVYLISVYRI